MGTCLGALLTTAVLAAVLVLSASLAPDGTWPAPGDAADASPSATSAPSPTPTPLSPREQIQQFALQEEVDSDLQFVRGGSEDVPPGDGVYFLDVASGEIDGVHAAGEGFIFSTNFTFAAGNRLIGVHARQTETAPPYNTLREHFYLIDRATRTVYGWQGDARLLLADHLRVEDRLSAAGSRVIFRLPDRAGPDYFAVVDLEPQPRVVARFEIERAQGITLRAEGPVGLVSQDGTKAVIVGGEIDIVDLTTGEIETVGKVPRLASRYIALGVRNTLDGDAFLVQIEPRGSANDGDEARWLHYTWTGELLAQGSGRSYNVSPRGDFMAIARAGPGFLSEPCCLVDVIDTRDGSDVFRIVGASLCSQGNEGNLMLADGSGVVLRTLSTPHAYVVATRDGISKLPFGNAPVPSPSDVSVFSIEPDPSSQVVRIDGSVLAAYDPMTGTEDRRPRDFIAPWGLYDGSAVRFVLHHFGHDRGCRTAMPVTPYVQLPPYDDALVLQLDDEAVGAPLFDAPAGANAVGEIATAARVTVLQTKLLDYEDHVELWAEIATPDGAQGWFLLQDNTKGV
jgi:hypothetical protein